MRIHPRRNNLLALAAASLLINLLAPASVAAGKNDKPIKLYGHIDELTFMSSSAGVQLSPGAFPKKVVGVSLGSSAAYSGLRDGDKVLSVTANDNNLLFQIERKGKRYEANVATDVFGLKAEFEHRKVPWALNVGAFDKQLEQLTSCELVFLLDRSVSMADQHAGVPGDLSKWAWCRQQIDNFYLATTKFFERGFDLVTFNHASQRYKSVSLWDLKSVFNRFKPEGTRKDIASPLNEVLTDYIKARKPDSKPLIVIVMTDGIKNEGAPLQQILIDASKQMQRPGEITVVFMQVGDSVFADELFDDLDRNLLAKGAKYDIAQFKSFSQLRNKGILWELLATLKDVQATGATAVKQAK